MKKKVALLLSLVMVLSLLPMNLFGASYIDTAYENFGNPQTVNLTLEASRFSEIPIPVGGQLLLELTVTGSNAGFRVFRNNPQNVFHNTTTGVVNERPGRRWPIRATGWYGDMSFLVTTSGIRTPSDAAIATAIDTFLVGLSGANTIQTITDTTTFEQVLDDARGATEWSGMFTNGVRRRMNGDRTPNVSGLSGVTDSEDGVNRSVHTSPMEHYRTITVPLGIEGWGWPSGLVDMGGGAITPEIDAGWIHLALPVSAASGGNIEARLIVQQANSVQRTVHNFGTFPIAFGGGGGVTIESRGVVSMTNIGRLNPIRITENGVGQLTGGVRNHIVKLVAPRGFVWDGTGVMPGLITGSDGMAVRGDSTVWPGAGNNLFSSNGASILGTWHNPITDRHEIYVHMDLPARGAGAQAQRTLAWVDLEGLVLIPVAGAPTTGDVAVDIWVGTTHGTIEDGGWATAGYAVPTTVLTSGAHDPWGSPNTGGNVGWTGDMRGGTNTLFLLGDTLADGRVRQTRFGWFGENNAPGSLAPDGVPGWRQDVWSQMNVVVANLDNEGGITVIAPTTPAQLVSGSASSSLIVTNNDRFMHGDSFTIRLQENMPRAMFQTFDRYELRVVQDGVTFVDAEVRVGNEDGASDEFAWTPLDAPDITLRPSSVENFVPAITAFEGGSLHFAPRTIDPDEDSRTRHMDIRLMLSVEAGFEARNGSDVEIEVLRDGVRLGSVVVANVTDPLRLERSAAPTEITRSQFDVIPLTPVGSVSLVETAVGNLRNNDEIWLHVQATQDGRPVAIPSGMLTLFVDGYSINSESNMDIEQLRGGTGNPPRSFVGDEITSQLGFRVIRPSAGTPATITFNNLSVAGPAVPGIEWHVVVSGAAREYANTYVDGSNNLQELVRNNAVSGISPNSHRYFPARIETSRTISSSAGAVIGSGNGIGVYQERARQYGLGYSQTILRVLGNPSIDHEDDDGPGAENVRTRVAWSAASIVDVDGNFIQAVAFPEVAPGVVSTMVHPRVFASWYGMYDSFVWNEVARTATFTGISTTGATQTVVLTLDSTNISVNGVNYDIAELSGQPALHGRIAPQVINGRQYVPARVLATIFGVPISFDSGVVSLG